MMAVSRRSWRLDAGLSGPDPVAAPAGFHRADWQAGETVNGIYEADYRDFNRETYVRGRQTFDATYGAFKRLLIGAWRRDELAAQAEAAE